MKKILKNLTFALKKIIEKALINTAFSINIDLTVKNNKKT